MLSKKWLLGACGGVLAGALAVNSANAGLVIDLRIVGINGAPAGNDKAAVVHLNDVVSINIFSVTRGANATSSNDGFQSLQGSLKAVAGQAGGAFLGGVFMPTGIDGDGEPTGLIGTSPFGDNGAVNGKLQDLNPKDGNPDLGGEPSDGTGIGDFLAIRAAAMQKTGGTLLPATAAGNDNGRQYLIGTFDYKVGQPTTSGGETDINYYPRTLTNGNRAQSAALWLEDAADGAKDASSGNLSAGAPIRLTTEAIPEPASLAMLGLIGGGLLARRRQR